MWLSTVRPDGTPHLVPTWFLWDGEALLVWSKPNAVKVRNLRPTRALMVALGDAAADFNVGLIEAAGRCSSMDATIPAAFLAKYATELAQAGLDPATYRATYTQAVRIVPTRFLAWHGRGEARRDVRRATSTTRPDGPRRHRRCGLARTGRPCRLRDLGSPSPVRSRRPAADDDASPDRRAASSGAGASGSRSTSRAAFRPGTPVTPPPGCAPDPRGTARRPASGSGPSRGAAATGRTVQRGLRRAAGARR